MRARLVAQERGVSAPAEGGVFESPLIEPGSVLLGPAAVHTRMQAGSSWSTYNGENA